MRFYQSLVPNFGILRPHAIINYLSISVSQWFRCSRTRALKPSFKVLVSNSWTVLQQHVIGFDFLFYSSCIQRIVPKCISLQNLRKTLVERYNTDPRFIVSMLVTGWMFSKTTVTFEMSLYPFLPKRKRSNSIGSIILLHIELVERLHESFCHELRKKLHGFNAFYVQIVMKQHSTSSACNNSLAH